MSRRQAGSSGCEAGAVRRPRRAAEALIAQAYLAGMNTRRVRRALGSLFAGKVGKDMVSRAWQRTRSAWEAWQKRDLAGEGIVRLILDGTVVKVRLDKKATAISLLIALGIRRDGQKVVLAIKNLGGESEAAWRQLLDDLATRGMAKPELVIVDGGKGLEAALASLWDDVPVQRCTVHKERNLLAHAPKHLHEEIKAECRLPLASCAFNSSTNPCPGMEPHLWLCASACVISYGGGKTPVADCPTRRQRRWSGSLISWMWRPPGIGLEAGRCRSGCMPG